MVDPASDVRLPKPRHDGEVSLEHALTTRRSIREFARGALTLAEVGQLLCAAQGVNHLAGLRTAPSAGALYPPEVYLAAGEVSALTLRPEPAHARENRRSRVSHRARQRALCQAWIAAAAAILVLAAAHQRMTDKYGSRGERYVQIEIGDAAQNIYLQTLALGLGTTEVGAFDDRAVKAVLGLAGDQAPLAIMPIGRIG